MIIKKDKEQEIYAKTEVKFNGMLTGLVEPDIGFMLKAAGMQAYYGKITFITVGEWIKLFKVRDDYIQDDTSALIGAYAVWLEHYKTVVQDILDVQKKISVLRIDKTPVKKVLVEEINNKKLTLSTNLTATISLVTILPNIRKLAYAACVLNDDAGNVYSAALSWDTCQCSPQKIVNELRKWAIGYNIKEIRYAINPDEEDTMYNMLDMGSDIENLPYIQGPQNPKIVKRKNGGTVIPFKVIE